MIKENLKKIVVKIGTSSLTQGKSKLCEKHMLELTRQMAILHEKGFQIILVSSGAIAAGRQFMDPKNLDHSLASKQMLAAVGQVQLMQTWIKLFALFEIRVGQILLTREDISHRKRYLNARDTLTCLLKHHVIPIINENDTVATKEIKVGDNDNLASLVASLIAADLLILLTDQKGLYTADPRVHSSAELIANINRFDKQLFTIASSTASSLGTGGMFTKMEAAQRASYCGIPTVITSSSINNVLTEIVGEGKQHGTFISTDITPQESRKRWLLSEKPCGTIQVDKGAQQKILDHGASLLPSGITQVSANFERGAIVQITGHSEEAIAVGISNYGAEEIKRMIGIHSDQIENILGYSYGSEIIHRTNMTRIKTYEGKKNEH